MNRNYKVVWNHSLGCFTAVAEYAKSQGKSSSGAVSSSSAASSAVSSGAKLLRLTAICAGLAASGFSMQSMAIVGAGSIDTTGCANGANQATGDIAIGCGSDSSGRNAIAIGGTATTKVSSGTQGAQSIAIGYDAQVKGDQSVGLGGNVRALGNSSIAIGGDDLNNVAGSNNSSAAAQTYKNLTGDNLVRAYDGKTGPNNQYLGTTTGNGAIAIGVQGSALGDLSTSFGTRTQANGIASTALGVGATSSKDGSVALGAGSKTDGTANSVTSATVGDVTFGGFAGSTGIVAGDQVSVGSVGNERQIKNLAAGNITATSTDAINGSQLFSVVNKPITFVGDTGGNVDRKLGQTLNIKGGAAGTLTTGNIGVVANGADGLDIQLAETIDLGAAGSVTTGNSVLNTTGLTITDGGNVTTVTTAGTQVTDGTNTSNYGADGFTIAGGPSVTSTGINAGNQKITNVDNGTIAAGSKDAVNGGQLFGSANSINTVIGGNATLNPDGTITTTDIGGTGENNINDAISNVKGAATAAKTTVTEGENILVTETVDALTGASNYEVKTKRNLDLDSVTTGNSVLNTTGLTITDGGNVTTVTTAGTQVTDGTNTSNYGADGFTIAGGPSVTSTGINAGNQKITNVDNGTIAAGSKDAVNGGQINSLVIAANNKINNLGNDTAAALGGSASYNPTTGAFTNPSYELDDGTNTNTKAPAFNNVGDALGNLDTRTTTNTADIAKGINFGNGTTDNNYKLGDTINVKGDSNIISTTTADGVQLGLANSITVGNTSPVTINGTTGTISGLSNTTFDPTNFTSGQAATEDQLAGLSTVVATQRVKYVSVNSTLGTNEDNKGATGADAIAIGKNTAAAGNSSTAVGYKASTTDSYASAFGESATAGYYGTAIGSKATAVSVTKDGSPIAVGTSSLSTGQSSIAIGDWARSTGINAIAIGGKPSGNYEEGKSTLADGERSIAIGGAAIGGGTDTIAMGTGARATANNAIAFGTQATSDKDGAVALGSNSTTATDTTNEQNIVIGGQTYTFAGQAVAGSGQQVSFGSAGSERQLKSVASGNISATSTDAINGSQLYGTNQAVEDNYIVGQGNLIAIGGGAAYDPVTNTYTRPTFSVVNNPSGAASDVNTVEDAITALNSAVQTPLTFAGDSGTNVDRKLGQTLNIKGGATGNLTTGNIGVVANGADGLDIQLAETIDLGAAGSVKTGNTTVNNAGITIIGGANPVSLTNTGLDNGGNKIINVANGTIAANSKDAVNGGQLFGTVTSIKNSIGGTTVVNPDGTITTSNVGNTGKDNIHDAIASVQNSATAAKTTVTAGKNIELTTSVDATTGATNYEVKTADNLDVVSVKTGNTTTNNSGVTVKDGNNQTSVVATGTNVVDGKGNTADYIATGSSLTDAAGNSNNTLATGNTVNDGKGNVANYIATGSNITDGTNTSDYTATGSNIADSSGNTNNSTATGNTIKDAAGNTTTVTAGGLTAGNTTDGKSTIVNQDGVSFTDTAGNATGPTITADGINAGDKVISGVSDGLIDSDAVNLGQLKDVATIAGKGFDITTANIGSGTVTGTTIANVAPGSLQTITAGNNIAITQNGIDLTIATNPNLISTSLTTGNTVTNDSGVTVNDGTGNVTSVVATGTNVVDGKGNTAAYIATGSTIADALGNSNSALATGNTVNDGKGNVSNYVATGANITNGTNTSNYGANGLVVTGATGNTIVNEAGLSFTDASNNATGPSITKTGINAGNQSIKGVANGIIGAGSLDAINGGQLSGTVGSIQTAIGGNTVVNPNGTITTTNIGNTGKDNINDAIQSIGQAAVAAKSTVTSGKNIVVSSGVNADGSTNYQVATSDNLDLTSVTTGNTVMNNNGITINNGPSITTGGINGGGQTITGVADGIKVNDAVNMGQLNALGNKLGGAINELGYRLNDVEDGANAGVSAAMAMSSIPQSFLPGKSMIGGGISTYNGQSAVAIGVSRVSDNGRWVININGSADTQGNAGGGIGAGFHF